MRVHMRVRERLCVELGAMRPDWNRWCIRRGMTVGEGVRQLIAGALGVHAEEARPQAEAQRTSTVEPRTRIEVRLTRAELEAVEQRAVMLGITSNRWIVALIRAQLTREPQFGAHEMQMLSNSNQQLVLISGWLGHLVREGCDAGFVSKGGNDVSAIREEIDVHLCVVAALIRANLDRWSR